MIAVVAAALVVVAVAGWWLYENRQARWAQGQIDALKALIEKQDYAAAYRLQYTLAPRIGGTPAFEKARESMMFPLTVTTSPEGARVFVKGYNEGSAEWIPLGAAPLKTRGVFGYFRWRVSKAGYQTFEGAAELAMTDHAFTLVPERDTPERMVYVRAGTVPTPAGNMPLEAVFIDRFEVTNREFKAFVDAKGYATKDYWREPFVKDGHTISWEEGIASFRDATGRTGPATWDLGAYPQGQDDFPVQGVSWYEAAAYAAWAGKLLPTVHHWRRAAGAGGSFSDILEQSNFSNKAVARVGEYTGLGPFGTYDMAGNVKEWCWNAAGDKRHLLGGAWNTPNYQYLERHAVEPFDRAVTNGFRTMKLAAAGALADSVTGPVDSVARDYSREQPVPDREFEAIRRLYAYDKSDLAAKLESTDDAQPYWRVERVSYRTAYGDQRIPAYLFLPRNASPPYQTVVYFPHSGGQLLRSFEQSEMNYLGFIVRSGRALLFPMYQNTYERRLARPPDGPHAFLDLTIARMKDLQRSVDYVFTRADLDHDRLGYFGVSMGARLGNLGLAIEPRLRLGVLWAGGYPTASRLPEVDEINFGPRVKVPVLMLNGKQDFTFPLETSQKPMFRWLGTPVADKRHLLFEGGHAFPFASVIKDTLDWLDKYFGAPKAK